MSEFEYLNIHKGQKLKLILLQYWTAEQNYYHKFVLS